MCGIVGIWAREGSFHVRDFDVLMTEAEKRGQDAFGIYVWDGKDAVSGKEVGKYSNFRYRFINGNVCEPEDDIAKGSVVLGICRAQPETEVVSKDNKSIQPIVKCGIALVHNGVVSNDIYEKYKKYGYDTEIDSEAIINAYIASGKDMQRTMKELSGGFAFILLDTETKRLYCVNDFKPLAIGYIKGKGFLVHSQESAIAKVVESITDCKRCGTNVWEDYYYHWQDGYTIREIDLDSGMERLYSFEANFKHPVWDKKTKDKELVLVSASGGIDSGLTAWILKKIGYDVRLMHFSYAHKGEEAERLAVELLGKKEFDYEEFDVRDLFVTDSSMLIKGGSEVTTGKGDDIKSTMAWVSNRNAVFMSYLVARAEQSILSNVYSKVYIASGMSNLSEEGFYPDNSEMFIRSFFESVRYSTIVGNRIQYLPVSQNLMKAEEWLLGDKLGFPFELTVSCDQPRIVNGGIELCNQCGSTLLSKWAAEMAGVKDPRKFYDSNVYLIPMDKKFSGKTVTTDIRNVIKRLRLPKEEDYKKLEAVCGLC